MEQLRKVAFADGNLDQHEQHLIKRIADLLYVRHSDVITSKCRPGGSAGRPASPAALAIVLSYRWPSIRLGSKPRRPHGHESPNPASLAMTTPPLKVLVLCT